MTGRSGGEAGVGYLALFDRADLIVPAQGYCGVARDHVRECLVQGVIAVLTVEAGYLPACPPEYPGIAESDIGDLQFMQQ